MTDQRPCSCPNSPWVQNANNYVAQHRANTDYRAHVEALEFLLNRDHCGMENRASVSDILNHLNENGIRLAREEFQNTVLGDLKRAGTLATLIYPGPAGGVFIPCSESEIEHVAQQIFARTISQFRNLAGMSAPSQNVRDIAGEAIQALERLLTRLP